MIRAITAFAALGLLPTLLVAQLTHTIPNGTANIPANSSNAFPWGSAATSWPGLRVMTVYDGVNFTAAGINQSIVITRLRWRANDRTGSWSGGTFAQASVELSTAAVASTGVTTAFASNHGPDRAVVFSGPVTIQAGASNGTGVLPPFAVDLTLTTPFTYDPTAGGLVIDVDYPGMTNFTGGAIGQMDVQTTGSNASRIFASSQYPNANGTSIGHGVVVEVEFRPAVGVFALFDATPTTGTSPLQVQFTDNSVSSDPGGVTSWAWDFDSDGTIDSTVQNPTHTYANCGNYTVSLTATDATNPANTRTQINFIQTDQVTAGFTHQVVAPGIVVFTDTSTPTPTAWAWDFDDDGTIDSTVQNPAFSYPPGIGFARVSLTASRLCGAPDTATQELPVVSSILTTLEGGSGFSGSGAGSLFDMTVTNPLGITLTGMVMSPWVRAAGPLTCDVYVTDAVGGYAANHTDSSVWRLVGTASATAPTTSSSTNPQPLEMTLSSRVHFTPGTYAMALHMNGAGVVHTLGNGTNQTFANSDVSLSLGMSKTARFITSGSSPRVWNGALLYDDCALGGLSGYGFFAQGCSGSLGVTTLTAASGPTIGSTVSINLDNLPQDAAIMALGLSNTSSPLGPLPFSLSTFGAPGCFATVSPDATIIVFGAGNTATWNLPIPNNPNLLCVRFFNQAFVIDPAANALGAVLSDAGAAIVGF